MWWAATIYIVSAQRDFVGVHPMVGQYLSSVAEQGFRPRPQRIRRYERPLEQIPIAVNISEFVSVSILDADVGQWDADATFTSPPKTQIPAFLVNLA